MPSRMKLYELVEVTIPRGGAREVDAGLYVVADDDGVALCVEVGRRMEARAIGDRLKGRRLPGPGAWFRTETVTAN
jgi:hypothetical protein